MLKRFGIPALALASALAIAAPTMSFARDRGGNERAGGNERGGRQVEQTNFRGRGRGDDHFDRDRHFDRDDDDRFSYGLNFYANPAPPPSGYYDQYGNWHPYDVYGQYGASNPYRY